MQVCLRGCWVGKGSTSLGCGVWKCWGGDTGKRLHWSHGSCRAGLAPVPATQAATVANLGGLLWLAAVGLTPVGLAGDAGQPQALPWSDFSQHRALGLPAVPSGH